jgi:hypothetical protein
MSNTMLIEERVKGQFPISIATSLAIDGLTGIGASGCIPNRPSIASEVAIEIGNCPFTLSSINMVLLMTRIPPPPINVCTYLKARDV